MNNQNAKPNSKMHQTTEETPSQQKSGRTDPNKPLKAKTRQGTASRLRNREARAENRLHKRYHQRQNAMRGLQIPPHETTLSRHRISPAKCGKADCNQQNARPNQNS
jgi:hypothetical protein